MIRWSTESNALKKSINQQRVYLLVSNMIDNVLLLPTAAAVVMPVGYHLEGIIAGNMWFLNKLFGPHDLPSTLVVV